MQFDIMVDPQSLTVLLVFTHDSYPSIGIFLCHGFPQKAASWILFSGLQIVETKLLTLLFNITHLTHFHFFVKPERITMI